MRRSEPCCPTRWRLSTRSERCSSARFLTVFPCDRSTFLLARYTSLTGCQEFSMSSMIWGLLASCSWLIVWHLLFTFWFVQIKLALRRPQGYKNMACCVFGPDIPGFAGYFLYLFYFFRYTGLCLVLLWEKRLHMSHLCQMRRQTLNYVYYSLCFILLLLLLYYAFTFLCFCCCHVLVNKDLYKLTMMFWSVPRGCTGFE